MKRIQRKRVKGWRMPENTVYVGRGTKWGNPVKLIGDAIFIDAGYRRHITNRWVYWDQGSIDMVLDLYRRIVRGFQFADCDLQYWSVKFNQNDLNELKGKDLACWCKPGQKCHADVLIKLISEL